MKQLLGFFFTLIGKAEKQYQKMNLPNYSDLIIQQFKIVFHSSVRLGFHRIVEPTVRQTNQTVSSSGIFSKNLTSFTNQL